jgi:hypothetical protein
VDISHILGDGVIDVLKSECFLKHSKAELMPFNILGIFRFLFEYELCNDNYYVDSQIGTWLLFTFPFYEDIRSY